MTAQLLLQAPARPRRAAVAGRVALVEGVRAHPRELRVGAVVLGARVAVAEVAARGRSPASRPAATVSATASGWSAKRAAIASGVASTWLWLPRRSGSEASSVVCSRIATNTSCRRARAAEWAWTLPVATHGTPSRARQRREPAVERAVVAGERPLELDPERVGPEGAEQRARIVGSSRTPWVAQPVRQTSPSAWARTSASSTPGGETTRDIRVRGRSESGPPVAASGVSDAPMSPVAGPPAPAPPRSPRRPGAPE